MPVKPQVAVTHAARTALAALGMAACASDALSPNARDAVSPSLSRADRSARTGAGYTLSNAAAGNQVIAFRRAADGALSPLGTFPTGGAGTGGAGFSTSSFSAARSSRTGGSSGSGAEPMSFQPRSSSGVTGDGAA